MEGRGATGRQQDDGRGHAHNNQIIHAEGGVVGNDDDGNDDNGHDDDGDNDNDGGCGGQDGHYWMRKGRGHEDRTNTTIKKITEERGEDGGDGSDDAADNDDDDDDDDGDDEATEQPWLWWWRVVSSGKMRGCFGNKIRHPR